MGAFDPLGFDAGDFDVATPIPPLPAAGPPTYPWNLFRGMVTDVSLDRNGPLLKLTLTMSDYNRLLPLVKLGVEEVNNSYFTQPDGTKIWFDPAAYTPPGGLGTDAPVVTNLFGTYWKGPFPLDATTRVHALINFDRTNSLQEQIWYTSISDLRALLDGYAQRVGPGVRLWIDADFMVNWTIPQPIAGEPDFRVQAPWSISGDGPFAGFQEMPISMPISYAQGACRFRLWVKGSTPVASLWVGNPDITIPFWAGEDYVDGQGAVTAETARQLGLAAFRSTFRELLQGKAKIQAGKDGWRVGQWVNVGDDVYSRYVRHPLPNPDYGAVVMGVSGRLVGPGGGLHISINGLDSTNWDAVISSWDSFTFTETGFGQPGTATVVLEILPDAVIPFEAAPGQITVGKNADVRIFTDGTADIEYDIDFGDIPRASPFTEAKAEKTAQALTTPVYNFVIWGGYTFVPVGGFVPITFQLVDGSGNPDKTAGVALETVLLQWSDFLETVPGTGYSLDDAAGLTNTLGQFYTFLRRTTGTAIVADPRALALPIA